MSRFDSGLSLPTKPARSPLKTEILWGCEAGGSPHFPRDMDTIRTRRRSLDPKPLDVFRKAVMNAVELVWVVDEYFLIPDKGLKPDARIQTILEWLHISLVASDIRILTKKHDEINKDMLERFAEREKQINAIQTRRATRCSIRVNTCLKQNFDFVHDRFAIVDDELWHFGATVGGFHTKINAASRDWSAKDSGAIDFFELAWKECTER